MKYKINALYTILLELHLVCLFKAKVFRPFYVYNVYFFISRYYFSHEFFFVYRKSTMVDAAVLEKLETGFKKLEASDSKSLLKKYLSREVFDALKTKKTPTFGSTLLDVIQSGMFLIIPYIFMAFKYFEVIKFFN